MPRARNANLHLLNCYYNTVGTGSYAIGIGGGVKNSTAYVEACDFADVQSVFRSFDTTDGGSESVNFVNCLNAVSNIGTTVAKPSYSYSSFPAEDVASSVGNQIVGAGATLTVTTKGVISSSGNSTEIKNIHDDSEINLFPSQIDRTLNIRFINSVDTETKITISNLEGQKILTFKNQIAPSETLKLDMSRLISGIYLCSVESKNQRSTLKFIKK